MDIHLSNKQIFQELYFIKLDNVSRQADFISWQPPKLLVKKIMRYLIGVWILNVRFSTTCNVSHQYLLDFGHQNDFRMWIAYRKYSLCTMKTAIKASKKPHWWHLQNSTFFKRTALSRELLFGILLILSDLLVRTMKQAFSVLSQVNSATCFGNFSHSSGNPLTWGSSDCLGVTVSMFPFSKATLAPESICLTAVWFRSTWKSAEIFLLSLRS